MEKSEGKDEPDFQELEGKTMRPGAKRDVLLEKSTRLRQQGINLPHLPWGM